MPAMPSMPSMLRTGLLTLLLVLLVACERREPPVIEATVPQGSATPWTGLAPLDAPEDFHFVVVTDRTGGHRPGVFSGAMPKVNLLSPAFVVSVGDLIEGYTEDPAQLEREWDEIGRFVERLDAPFFYAPGNHDMSNAVMAETWQRRFGPSYYHFKYKGVLFVVLNSELFGMVGDTGTPVPGPWQQAGQMDFVRKVLADHADARWTVVLLHQPLWDTEDIDPDWLEVENLLGSRNYTVFAGHYHRYTRAIRHDRKYITLATTGGGSPLRGTAFGEFDHVAWVTMRADGPVIANVLLDGIQRDDVLEQADRDRLRALEQAVSIEPFRSSEAEFRDGTQTVRIHNPHDAPLQVVARLARAGNFVVDLPAPLTVAPGETAEVPVKMATNAPTPYGELRTAAIDWTLTTVVADRPVQLTLPTPVLPLGTFPILTVSRTPAIDGDLADWGKLEFSAEGQGDAATPPIDARDAAFRFAVRRDPTTLYLAVDVHDDSIVADEARTVLQQDSLWVQVDARPEADREANLPVNAAVRGGTLAQSLQLMIPLGAAADDPNVAFTTAHLASVQHAIVRTATGYRVEIAVPGTVLDAQAGRDWRDARITVAVNDLDDGESRPTLLHWQPWRYGQAPMAGTHAFVGP